MPKKSLKNRKITEESKVEPPKLMREYYGIPIIIMILTVIGAALRFYHLDFNSLWLDEISTYNYSSSTFIGMWQVMLTGTDYNPPLFFILERVILVGFGVSETTLRVLPALFGTLTIPMIYLIGKEFRDTYTGLIAAGIFTFSPFLIFYSQEARPYALVLLLCTGLMWTFLRALKSNIPKDWIYFSIIAAALIWVHFYATVFVIILGIFAVIKNRNTIRPLLISIIVGAILILPIAIVFIPLFLQRTSSIPSFGMQGLPLVYGMIIQLSGFSVMSGILWLCLFIIGTFWLYTKNKEHAILLLWILCATGIFSLLMASRMPVLPRHMIFLVIPLVLGIVGSFEFMRSMLSNKISTTKVIIGVLIFFAIIGLPFYITYYQGYSKEDWRGIAKDLEKITVSGDTVVLIPSYLQGTLGFYYSSVKDQTVYTGVEDAGSLVKIKPLSNKSVYFLVTGDINAADPSGGSVKWLNEYTKPVKSYGNVFLLKGI